MPNPDFESPNERLRSYQVLQDRQAGEEGNAGGRVRAHRSRPVAGRHGENTIRLQGFPEGVEEDAARTVSDNQQLCGRYDR